MKQKLVVILGPTASGKSGFGIKLAKKFKGEIISADSRQVYKGMDLGSGKVTKKEQKIVPHFLLDVSSPKKQFTVTQFKKMAEGAIKKITRKNKLPFIVGGTAFYIYALTDDLQVPEVKPNSKLRKSLEIKSVQELFIILKNLDPQRARHIDKNNPRRLIRAIEINIQTGKSVPVSPDKKTLPYDLLFIGLNQPQKKLYQLIDDRVDQRIKQGMTKEVKSLNKSGLSFKRLESFGLEYKYISLFLQGRLSKTEMIDQLKSAIHKFSKRQMTWFKKDTRINWITSQSEAERLVKDFLSK